MKGKPFMKNITNETSDKTAVRKARGRSFNIIDVLIILAVLLLGAIVVNVIAPTAWFKEFMSDSEQVIQYTVEFTGVDRDFVDNINENDTVVDAVSKFSLGNVTAVDNDSHYKVLGYNEQTHAGGYVTYQDKYNVLVTVTVTADYEEGVGYSVSDRRIAVGEKLSLRFPNFVGEGYCIGISATETGGALDE